MEHLLLVDSNYLCYRAYRTTGGLSHQGKLTGVAFGFIRDIEILSELFEPSIVVFAFDAGGPGKRSEISSVYKSSRQEMTEEEREEKRQFYDQVHRLRSQILPDLGYKNVIWRKGYEADDIIAKIAEDLRTDQEATMISADGDLFQCLSDRVSFYNPHSKKITTAKKFREQWGLAPSMWASVKALAGCGTDDVEGIRGVGEVTAAKWFNGKLKPDSKGYKLISDNLEVFNKNIDLVKLPFPGLELPELVPDDTNLAKLMKVKADLGIKAKRTRVPGGFDLESQ